MAEDLAEVNRIILDRLSSENPLIAHLGMLMTSPMRKRREACMYLLLARVSGNKGRDACVVASILDLIVAALDLHGEIAGNAGTSQTKAVLSGLPTAVNVLASDFLYTRAFQMVSELGEMALIRLLSEATTRSAEGAVMMLAWTEHSAVNDNGYLMATLLRRGSLIEAAAKMAMQRTSGDEASNDGRDALVRHMSTAIALGDELQDRGLCNPAAGGHMYGRARIELDNATTFLGKLAHSSYHADLIGMLMDAVPAEPSPCLISAVS